MNLFRQAARALGRAGYKLAYPSQGGMTGPGYGMFRFTGPLPGAAHNYELEVGDPWLNSIVMPCLAWIQRAFPEAKPQVVSPREATDSEAMPVANHPLVRLLSAPNPYTIGEMIWYPTILSWFVDGNSYWYKDRFRRGRGVAGLRYIPHFLIAPQWDITDPNSFVTHYLYRVNGEDYRLEVDDVIHFKHGEDPRNQRLGLAPLKALLREIYTDNEAATYSAAIMRNMGVPGAIISPVYPDVEFEEPDRQALIDLWGVKFTGEQRGKPMVPSMPVKVEKVAMTPEEMTLDRMRVRPEDRVCATFGISPMVVGISSGHDQRTYNNYGEAKQAAYDNCLIPTQKVFAEFLDTYLLPEMGDAKRERVSWFYGDVRVLMDDADKLSRRKREEYKIGLIKRSEGRKALGYKSDASDEIYFTDIQPKTQPGAPGAGGTGSDSSLGAADKQPKALLSPNRVEEVRAVGVGEEHTNGKA